jgi:hypothetical protein
LNKKTKIKKKKKKKTTSPKLQGKKGQEVWLKRWSTCSASTNLSSNPNPAKKHFKKISPKKLTNI